MLPVRETDFESKLTHFIINHHNHKGNGVLGDYRLNMINCLLALNAPDIPDEPRHINYFYWPVPWLMYVLIDRSKQLFICYNAFSPSYVLRCIRYPIVYVSRFPPPLAKGIWIESPLNPLSLPLTIGIY